MGEIWARREKGREKRREEKRKEEKIIEEKKEEETIKDDEDDGLGYFPLFGRFGSTVTVNTQRGLATDGDNNGDNWRQ